jgi:hypothetical protein
MTCRCLSLPFSAAEFEMADWGADGYGGRVTLYTCPHCTRDWLHYALDGSARWWCVEVLDPPDPILCASTARDYIERQAEGFAGTALLPEGLRLTAPIRID